MISELDFSKFRNENIIINTVLIFFFFDILPDPTKEIKQFTQKHYHLYLSYALQDNEKVFELYRGLREKGIFLCLDWERDQYRKVSFKQNDLDLLLKRSEKIIILLSDFTLKESNYKEEIKKCLNEKSKKMTFV